VKNGVDDLASSAAVDLAATTFKFGHGRTGDPVGNADVPERDITAERTHEAKQLLERENPSKRPRNRLETSGRLMLSFSAAVCWVSPACPIILSIQMTRRALSMCALASGNPGSANYLSHGDLLSGVERWNTFDFRHESPIFHKMPKAEGVLLIHPRLRVSAGQLANPQGHTWRDALSFLEDGVQFWREMPRRLAILALSLVPKKPRRTAPGWIGGRSF
jgi:hypothetical protein